MLFTAVSCLSLCSFSERVCVAVFGRGECDDHRSKARMSSLQRQIFDSLFAALSLASFMLSCTGGLKRSQLAFKREAQTTVWNLTALPSFLYTHCKHTHKPVCLYNCIFANTDMHISWTHMPVHTDTNTGAHTYADAGTHPGVPWRLVRCAVLQDWIISQLWVGQPRICPNPSHSVHIASQTRTHSLQARPQPSRGLYQVWFVCLLQSFSTFCLSFFSPSFVVPTRFCLPPRCVHTSQRPLWKVPSISPVSAPARQERVDGCVCPQLAETCKPLSVLGRSWITARHRFFPPVLLSPWNQAFMFMRVVAQSWRRSWSGNQWMSLLVSHFELLIVDSWVRKYLNMSFHVFC